MPIRAAEAVAFYRALETTERARAPLFLDPYAHLFLPRGLALRERLAGIPVGRPWVTRSVDRGAPGMRLASATRTRFIDDAVRARLAGGATDFVIFGAGFDCRAHRIPEASGRRVFEVDHDTLLAEKRASLRRAPLPVRPDVRYVGADLVRHDVGERLAAAGYDRAARTVFVCEGVANYLPEEAVLRLLRFIGGSGAGSYAIFSYVDRRFLTGARSFPGGPAILRAVRRGPERWLSGFVPGELGSILEHEGLSLEEELGADEYRSRYLGPFPDASRYSFLRLAVARVG